MSADFKVSHLLSEYLNLPQELIFSRRGEFSDLCITELRNLVKLPKGYSFSADFRNPLPGEYFLDVETLISENRLLVYRAIQSMNTSSIIMKVSAVVDSHSCSNMKKVAFNIDVCVNNSNVAYVGDNKVTLLAPYVDSAGYVVVVDPSRDRALLVHIDELRNARSSYDHSPSPNVSLTDDDVSWINNLLADLNKE